jgi:hypothetical protein
MQSLLKNEQDFDDFGGVFGASWQYLRRCHLFVMKLEQTETLQFSNVPRQCQMAYLDIFSFYVLCIFTPAHPKICVI